MRTIMIVDDELLARLGLKSLIPWEEYGFSLIFEAENGQTALDFAVLQPPDIIICDMKMPVMDGVTLIKELKSHHIPSQIIAASAYDDFHFVKQALQEGACDYLLKSELTTASLLKALECASSRLTESSLQNYTFTPGHLKLLQEDFMKNLFSGRTLPDSYIKNQQSLLGMQLPSRGFFCFSVKISKPENGALLLTELKDTLEDVLSSTMKSYGLSHVLLINPDHAMIMTEPHRELHSISQTQFIQNCAESLSHMITMLFNCSCHIGCSRFCDSLMELPSAHQQALDAMEKSVFTRKEFIQYSSFTGDIHIEFSRTLDEELKNIESALADLDSNRLRHVFEQLIHKIQLLEATDLKYLRGICHALIFITNQQTAPHAIASSQIWGKDETPYDLVERFENRWQYCRWIQQLSCALLQSVNPENENQRIILEAKRFIVAHFNSNLSLDFVADYLSLSPNYFSKIFKKYTGTGFVDYLTDLRIAKAEELLKSGKYKIYEVASMVGYENATYFSRIFKKKTGIPPYQVKADLSINAGEQAITTQN